MGSNPTTTSIFVGRARAGAFLSVSQPPGLSRSLCAPLKRGAFQSANDGSLVASPQRAFRREQGVRKAARFYMRKAIGHIERYLGEIVMIRKLNSGQYRLYSRKINPKTGKRRNLGTFKSRAAAEKHERDVQYFKRH
jgi:hypothetical protein